MIGRLRTSRVLALLLLLATPGMAGTALEALHPCPEAAPAYAAGAAAAGAHAGHDADAGHESSGHTAECHCVGACAVSAVAPIAAASSLPTVAVTDPAARVIRAAPARLPASPPSDRLPPSTAPPLV